jgi:hypothetical protein
MLALLAPIAMALLVALAPSRAYATDPTLAEALFREGRALMLKKDFAAACPRLAESQRLDPSPGTEFNLARCYELLGRLASAWGAYLEVAAEMRATGDAERAAMVRERIDALEPRLSYLTVTMRDTAQARHAEITRDDTVMSAAQLDVAIPVDAGTHVVRARAPGRRDWEARVAVEGEAQRVTVAIPELERMPPANEPSSGSSAPPLAAANANAPPPSGEAPRPRASAQRTIGIALVGGGVIAAGIGGYFGVRAFTLASDARDHCDPRGCDPRAFDLRDDSRTAGNVATVAFVTGGALAAVGGVLWWTAPKHAAPGIAFTPSVGRSSASLTVTARWP